ncbi:ATP/GTP-binding protein [Streptomyces achromogenes]|uniref:ATP/GTP-binding protein n=1 Tax=Streptomyces achromogenes TaxID=67255 RepID=UPI003408674B
MSDESDESGSGTLVRGPWSGDSTYAPPPVPDFADTIAPPEDIPETPPESPEETTMELPPIPAAPDPAMALRSEGITAPETGEDDGEYEEGEYAQPRSLADRLGDWLEFRLERARARHESEAPFREAEIARKVALLEGRTAQEVAMMEQNAKLHTAMMKAKGDKATARGKADADRMKSTGSGMGVDKGRSKAGGGGGSRGGGGSSGGPGRGTGGGRGPGTQGSGGSGGGNSSKGAGKDSDRSAGGRGGGSKGNESSGGAKGRQNGSGGSGAGKPGSGKGSSGGSGSSGAGKGGSKSDGGSKGGGASQNSPTSARAERARGRQERAGARQAARQQRRGADQAARLADRSKDRDQDRANRQAEWEERRRAKAERKAARKAKREAAKAAEDRTTLGAAVMEGIQDRWDKRRADKKAAEDGEKAGPAKDEDSKDKADKDRAGGGEDEKATKDGSEGASGAGGDSPASDEPGKKSKAAGGSKERRWKRRRRTGTGRAKRRGRTRRTGRKERGGTGGTGRRGRTDSPFGAEDTTPKFVWPEHPTRPPEHAGKDEEEDIEDAVIVPDEPAAVTTGVKGLPPAPEKHTQRPSTTRPTAQEDPVASEVSRPTSGQAGMAAQHRTDITFGEYLMEIVNIAVAAGADKGRAQDLAVALGKVADALRDMAADLVGDHNIATEVVDQITDLADAADRMKQLAERCATECEIASEAARIAAVSVGRVYGEDIQAMDDAGLAHASAAAHHD